ncbi:MAG TPA: diaminopimelate epimerase [Chloroflexota bacterium]|jgi:diaminopimelate epimerase|nr:diaminopimelate epimerase [Chloroflexota bacterium]
MRFIKMHGIGNDYVYVNGYTEKVADPESLAVRISDRHMGVGGDGLIMVLPPEPGVEADVRMRMFNADGSEAEMCGNGIRCVAKLSHDYGITTAKPLKVQTGAGVLTLDYTLDSSGKLAAATVDMGEPILESERIPVHIAGHPPSQPVINIPGTVLELRGWSAADQDAAGLERCWTAVSMGNPHVIFYVRDVQAVPLEIVGPQIEQASTFPRRVNVHFVQLHSPGEVTMRTWERGSGITLACGTGASAVCVGGVLTDRTGRQLLAHLPGGDLKLEWRESDNHVLMTGSATEVFSGEWTG